MPSTSYVDLDRPPENATKEAEYKVEPIVMADSSSDNISMRIAIKRSHSRSPELSNNKISKSESTSSNEAVLDHEEEDREIDNTTHESTGELEFLIIFAFVILDPNICVPQGPFEGRILPTDKTGKN